MRLALITSLGIKNRLKGAVVASCELVALLAIGITIHMEVLMSISIATSLSLTIVAIGLVVGVGFLGSQASSQREER